MKVSISQVRPNPFQARQQVDRERVQALADEIKTLGYWGSLRARKNGGHYELCFGHRRLEALKLLNIKDVELELVELSDEDMATQGLVENLQREGLTELEKATGIHHLIDQFENNGHKSGRRAVANLMGLTDRRIEELLDLLKLTPQSKQLISRGEIAGKTATYAKRLGGEAMIDTAAKHKLSLHTISGITKELAAIPDATIREKIKKDVVAGKVLTPETVRLKERKLRAQHAGPEPTDLRIIIRKWTATMKNWNERLDEVLPFMDYVEEDPSTVTPFKAVTRELIVKLKRFL